MARGQKFKAEEIIGKLREAGVEFERHAVAATAQKEGYWVKGE